MNIITAIIILVLDSLSSFSALQKPEIKFYLNVYLVVIWLHSNQFYMRLVGHNYNNRWKFLTSPPTPTLFTYSPAYRKQVSRQADKVDYLLACLHTLLVLLTWLSTYVFLYILTYLLTYMYMYLLTYLFTILLTYILESYLTDQAWFNAW